MRTQLLRELYKVALHSQRAAHAHLSDCKVESATSEALLGTGLRLDARVALTVGLLLGLPVVLLSALLLVVATLHLLQLAGQPLNLVLVLVDLGLVHVQLGSHRLHLVGLLLQVLLVDRQLLSDFGAGLSSKQVLQLNIQFFLLLDDHVLLNNILSLLDETLLECLNLLEHFPGVGIGAFELSPPVVVERVLELFRQSLDAETLVLELLVQVDDVVLEVGHLISLRLDDAEFALQIRDRVVQDLDIQQALVILGLALAHVGLENLDLLVQESQLVISADKLRA